MKRLSTGLLLLAACSSSPAGGGNGNGAGGSGPDAGAPAIASAVSLSISPEAVVLTTDGIAPARQPFTVTATLEDGTTRDVSASVAYTLSNPAAGGMTGALFTSAVTAAETTLIASAGALSASASIRVVLERVLVIPPGTGQNPLPPNPAGMFGGAPDPMRAPRVVYPNDGVLLPPNLGGVEIHYRRGRSNTLFEISLSSPRYTLRVITRCDRLGDGCLFALDGMEWARVAEIHAGRDPVSVRVRATDDMASGVGVSPEIRVHFAAKPVIGGLYYWTTSNGTGIMRVDFAGADRVPERYFPFRGGGCYGCHALSRNGRRMSLSQNGQWNGQLTLLDVASRSVLVPAEDDRREQFQSWNPSSDRFAGVYGDADPPDTRIRIRNGLTGEVLETIPIGNEVSHPDWSPLGDEILFTWVTHHYTSQRPGRGGIAVVKRGGDGRWRSPEMLVRPEDGKNRYYPAWSPDGQFLVYDESTCPRGETYTDTCDGDADPSARLWALPAAGGTPIALENANARGAEDTVDDLSNTFPKWAPFVDARYADGRNKVMWMTFSSRRKYGLRSPEGSNQLLWMVAIDPEQIAVGRDGSAAAFALPFQDLTTSNHIAQWAAQIVPDTRSDGGLDMGCVQVGDQCTVGGAACCGGASCVANGPSLHLCRPNI